MKNSQNRYRQLIKHALFELEKADETVVKRNDKMRKVIDSCKTTAQFMSAIRYVGNAQRCGFISVDDAYYWIVLLIILKMEKD